MKYLTSRASCACLMSVTLIADTKIVMIKVNQKFKKQGERTYDIVCSGAERPLPRTDCSNKSQKTKECLFALKHIRMVSSNPYPKSIGIS